MENANNFTFNMSNFVFADILSLKTVQLSSNMDQFNVNTTQEEDEILCGVKPTRYELPQYFTIFATVYLCFIDIFIVTGNAWVIFIIVTKVRKSMYLLSSLVVSDLLTGVASIPLYLLWIHHRYLFLSHPMCFGSMMSS